MPPRLATTGDVPALVHVINRAYVVERFFARGDRTDAEEIRRRMAAPGSAFLVIEADDGRALDAAVQVTIEGKRGHFAMLSVDPDQQRRGLARVLIGAIEQHCRHAGCSELDLDIVDLRTELPAFYARFGFAVLGPLAFPDPDKLTQPAHLIRLTKALA